MTYEDVLELIKNEFATTVITISNIDNGVKPNKTVPKWIPCSERLPSDGRAVLVYEAQNRNIFMATYEDEWFSWDICDDDIRPFDGSDHSNIVAWLPLDSFYTTAMDQAMTDQKAK